MKENTRPFLILIGEDKGEIKTLKRATTNYWVDEKKENAYEFEDDLIFTDIIPVDFKNQCHKAVAKYSQIEAKCIERRLMLEKALRQLDE